MDDPSSLRLSLNLFFDDPDLHAGNIAVAFDTTAVCQSEVLLV